MPTQNSPVNDPASGKTGLPESDTTENKDSPPQDMVHETEPLRKPSRIRYTASCYNHNGKNFDYSQDEPFPSQVPRHDETAKPIVEVVTIMNVALTSNLKPSNEKNDEKGNIKKETLANKVIRGIGSPRIIIHFPYLSELIRDTVDYYPGQNLTGETITIHEPYGVLLHHWETLSRIYASREDPMESTTMDRATKVEHLGVLIEYLNPIVKSQLEPMQRRLGQDSPTTTWDELWYLLRPGSQNYCKWDGQWIGCVVEETRKCPPDADDNLPERWKVKIWFLSMHWTYGTLITVYNTIDIHKFEGEKKVGQLDIFPEKFFKGERKKDFEIRGNRICDMLWKGHEYAHYDGELMSKKKIKYKGQIILSAFVDQAPDFDEDEWGGEKLKIIKALAERQMTSKPWSADYIRNKGEGVVILLHGPPGVGKTYTVGMVGHIDDAFMSRVHAVIGFDQLDGERRAKIWDSLLMKLNREQKGAIRISNGAKKFLKTPEVLEYTDWNGREIRNAFQTAIALAEYEAKNASDYDHTQEIIVEAEHFKDVMAMNKFFRSYLDSIKDRNEGERAQSAAWRNDSWNAEEKGN
ncbi:uncharacterized protein N0V96_011367 [Colletotrichum fioriniae]|uniref:uncharacterized protein n=1 Tax=Colletotrichum fioriniae TaxID=710243 RepID=UPI0032DB30A8|nr:hypothetical protein N0V96_011367 [Colletotrichum fioriniae]